MKKTVDSMKKKILSGENEEGNNYYELDQCVLHLEECLGASNEKKHKEELRWMWKCMEKIWGGSEENIYDELVFGIWKSIDNISYKSSSSTSRSAELKMIRKTEVEKLFEIAMSRKRGGAKKLR